MVFNVSLKTPFVLDVLIVCTFLTMHPDMFGICGHFKISTKNPKRSSVVMSRVRRQSVSLGTRQTLNPCTQSDTGFTSLSQRQTGPTGETAGHRSVAQQDADQSQYLLKTMSIPLGKQTQVEQGQLIVAAIRAHYI